MKNKTIAILPFVNMISNVENEYFSDGITEEIINVLAKIISMKLTLTKVSFKKIALSFVLILSLSSITLAQTIVKNGVETLDENKSGKNEISIAYFGETVTHPGLTLGIERNLWEKKKLKLISSANIGWYTHPRHHCAAFLNIEGGFRSTTSFGLYSDFFLGIGYHHSWVNGDVYVSDGGDDVKIIRDAGRPHLMTNVSFGLGWDFSKKTSSHTKLFIRIKPMFIYPVNNNMLIQAAAMVGVIWPL